MNAHGIAKLRESIGQGPDCRDLGWLNAGVDQGAHPGFPPTLSHGIQVRVEVAEHDVAVRVNQGKNPGELAGSRNWCGGHGWTDD
jgi:hypothetical protein